MEKNIKNLKLVKVRFWGNPHPHTFLADKYSFGFQQKVIAKSDRGVALGFINSFVYEDKNSDVNYEPIIRVAKDQDLEQFEKNKKKCLELKVKLHQWVEDLNLEMKISHVCIVDKLKYIIYFTADNKVDFRELLKVLRANKYNVELRHITYAQQLAALGEFNN